MNEKNKVEISGVVESELEFNNTQYGESFYKMIISAERNSGIKDSISLLISERLINIRESHVGKFIKVKGEFRSHNLHEEDKSKLILYVFVREFEFVQDTNEQKVINHIELEGYICKKPVFRITPLGREVTDIIFAVNRIYGKSDYIPCICWGRNAKYIEHFNAGNHFKLSGRIQSRMYVKKDSEGNEENKIAYEVSINQLEVLGDKKCV